MQAIVEGLAANPLLLLFLVAAVGYPLGRIRVAGVSFGTAAILFTGIAFGALDPRLKLPDAVYLLGLILFVYTLGLSAAASFWRAFDRRGLRDVGLCVLALGGSALVLKAIAPRLGLDGSAMAGAFSGAFTNAPGLAGIVDTLHASGASDAVSNAPVVAYAVAYPLGIVVPMLAMLLARGLTRIDLRKEAEGLEEYKRAHRTLTPATIRVERAEVVGLSQDEIVGADSPDLIFGRVRTADGRNLLPGGSHRVGIGDLVVAVGPRFALDALAQRLGSYAEERLELDRGVFDFRRLFVSNAAVVGKPLWQLKLPEQENLLITRVRRGDMDFIPTGGTVLELGDRVRAVARPEDMERATAVFGDSYKALSEVDLLSLSLGVALGLALGLVPIPLPFGPPLRLGFAGGPLVAALVLGRLRRTGPVVWTLPYSANLTVRNVGLLLFSAGIGTKAGWDFWATVSAGRGAEVLIAAGIMVPVAALIMFGVGRALGIPLNFLFGLYAGTQTQPVVLGFAQDRAGNDLSVSRYATIFPVATVAKIVLAQLLFGAAPISSRGSDTAASLRILRSPRTDVGR